MNPLRLVDENFTEFGEGGGGDDCWECPDCGAADNFALAGDGDIECCNCGTVLSNLKWIELS